MQITPVIAPKSSSEPLKSRTSKVRSAAAVEPPKSTASNQPKAATVNPRTSSVIKSKKAAASAKSKTKVELTASSAEASTTSEPMTYPSGEALSGMIAQAAFFIAAQRNFAPGNELDDWLQAEREILRRFPQ